MTNQMEMVNGVLEPMSDEDQIAYDAQQSAWPVTYATQQLVSSAILSLVESDKTMLRIQESVSLSLTTWSATDVIAWISYRRVLRHIISSKTGNLPEKPSYPSGT